MNYKEFFAHKDFKEIKGALVNNLGYDTVEDITKDGYRLHHTSIGKGYQSRYFATANAYEGKFGKGVIVVKNNPRSTYYGKLIMYFVK